MNVPSDDTEIASAAVVAGTLLDTELELLLRLVTRRVHVASVCSVCTQEHESPVQRSGHAAFVVGARTTTTGARVQKFAALFVRNERSSAAPSGRSLTRAYTPPERVVLVVVTVASSSALVSDTKEEEEEEKELQTHLLDPNSGASSSKCDGKRIGPRGT